MENKAQDTKAETLRQTGIHTIIFMVNAAVAAGRILGEENKKLARMDRHNANAINIAGKGKLLAVSKIKEQIEALEAQRQIFGNIHWANFVCVQNIAAYAAVMMGLLEECGCQECIETLADFKKEHQELLELPPKLTGPRANYMRGPETCPCKTCEAARQAGETPQHFAE